MHRSRPYRLLVAVALILAFTIPDIARADLRSEIVDTAKRITNRIIIPDFTPFVQDSHPGLFREYRIIFPKTRGMDTFVDITSKEISISSDLLVYTFFVATGAATTQVAPEYSPTFPNYLAHVILAAQKKDTDPLSSVTPFWQFASIPHATAASIERSPLYLRAFELYFSHALAFIIAHETCHIVKDHTAPNTSNLKLQEQEFEADAYAMEMLHKLGTYISPGISVLYPYMSTKPQIKIKAMRKHPDISCRLYKIFETELPLLESNPGYTDAITQHSIDTARLRDEMEKIKEHCLSLE